MPITVTRSLSTILFEWRKGWVGLRGLTISQSSNIFAILVFTECFDSFHNFLVYLWSRLLNIFFTVFQCRIFYVVICSTAFLPPSPFTNEMIFISWGSHCVPTWCQCNTADQWEQFQSGCMVTYLFWFHGLIYFSTLISRLEIAITNHCYLDFRCPNLWGTRVSLFCVFSF